jgi:hypothetical protein
MLCSNVRHCRDRRGNWLAIWVLQTDMAAMRYRLRTLLIVLALGPLVLAVGWWKYAAWKAEQERRRNAQEQIWIDVVPSLYSDDLTKFFAPLGEPPSPLPPDRR